MTGHSGRNINTLISAACRPRRLARLAVVSPSHRRRTCAWTFCARVLATNSAVRFLPNTDLSSSTDYKARLGAVLFVGVGYDRETMSFGNECRRWTQRRFDTLSRHARTCCGGAPAPSNAA